MKTLSSPVRRLVFTTACFVVLGVYAPGAIPQPVNDPERAAALRVFHERVAAYAALHERLEQPLPPLDVARETVRNYVNRHVLASAIRRRAPARARGTSSPRRSRASSVRSSPRRSPAATSRQCSRTFTGSTPKRTACSRS
jgi:hypothetical protein